MPAAHRLGACIGIPIMANAVAAAAFHRHRGGPGQDLELDLRQAIHSINPGAFWQPTLNSEPAPHPLVLDNPFLLTPYRTADGRWVMASGVYPHLSARWCRFLDVPPDGGKVAAAIQRWDAFELEQMANAAGLPACVIRQPLEWLAHPQGALLASQPVIGLERIPAPRCGAGRSAWSTQRWPAATTSTGSASQPPTTPPARSATSTCSPRQCDSPPPRPPGQHPCSSPEGQAALNGEADPTRPAARAPVRDEGSAT